MKIANRSATAYASSGEGAEITEDDAKFFKRVEEEDIHNDGG